MPRRYRMWYILENETEYDRAIARFEELKHSKPGTTENKEKKLLVKLISDYEESNYHFDDIDPIELIKIRMKEFGLKQKDLQVTNKGLISKILNYKRPLSLNYIRVFSKELNIPADLLIKEYDLVSDK